MRNSVLTLTRLFATLAFLCILGCGGGKSPFPPPSPPGGNMNLPDWFLSPPKNPGYLYTATDAASANLRVAIASAEQRGRGDMVIKLQNRTDTQVNDFLEQAGVAADADIRGAFKGVSETIGSQLMQGLGRKELEVKEEKSLYHAYVLMELPIGEERAKLLENIKSDKHLYDLFRSNQAFKELEEKAQKYREDLKQQGLE